MSDVSQTLVSLPEQYFFNSCPGICPGLSDCLSCTIHGSAGSAPDILGLGNCSWCSHLSTCTSASNDHICTKQDNSWWNDAVKISNPGTIFWNLIKVVRILDRVYVMNLLFLFYGGGYSIIHILAEFRNISITCWPSLFYQFFIFRI